MIREFSELLEEAKNPSSLVAIGVALLGVVYYFFNASKESSNASRRRVIAIALVMLSSAVFIYNIAQVIPTHDSNAAYKNIEQPYSLSVVVNGVVKTSVQSDRQSFRVSSGQLNVGCNDSRPAIATWSILPGSTDIQGTASWQNIDNVKAQNVSPPHQEGSVWTASGSIVGLDRNFFGDCPGGGHGELILEGSYRPQDTTLDNNQTLETYADKISRGQRVFIPLPQEKNKIAKSCEIKVSAGSDVRSVKLTLTANADGKLAIASQSNEGAPLTLTLSDNRLAISIP